MSAHTVTAAASSPTVSSLTASAEPRVRLEFGGTQRTLLDGGWWPRSADPVAELPSLVLVIDVVHGPITGLVLSDTNWSPRPRRLAVNDRNLRLAYFASQPAALLTAFCDNGARVDLLVVPPETDGVVAGAAMTIAATSTNRIHVEHILPAAVQGRLSEATQSSEDNLETKDVTAVLSVPER
jgi:Family of unknown function (DUF5994)